ncbi:hypothetical protein SS50377_23538 [Spironucleus salmonicida]|uniref:CFA20 domain-containing protein n=1 Tax=Spironucleus salmonicida TaxID=348837 RepID=V6LVA2_9EUKA|nr:hypothetical protein SS50377_23538 [Spironucleus salmonicida]|eukprot:EST48520.1 hypothetical protein SS50377_11130 [Spironucleus salmonicida]
MSAAGSNKVSYPNVADLKYSNTLDLFKVLSIPRMNFSKTGQVSQELDHVIKKSVVYVRGPVSSANRFLVPSKISQQFCLPQRYLFIQISPDISFHTAKDINTQTHTSLTLQTQSISGQTVRFQLTTLTQIPKVSASSVILPLRLQRWSTLVIDFHQLYKLAYNNTFTYRGLLQFEATATCVVKGVYMSNLKYSPFDQIEMLRLQAPSGFAGAPISNLLEHYDWIEYGIREFDVVKRQNLQYISQRDIFSQNISHAMPFICDLTDFQSELIEFQQKEQQIKEIKNQSRNKPLNNQNNRLSQTLSTYKAAKIQKPNMPKSKFNNENLLQGQQETQEINSTSENSLCQIINNQDTSEFDTELEDVNVINQDPSMDTYDEKVNQISDLQESAVLNSQQQHDLSGLQSTMQKSIKINTDIQVLQSAQQQNDYDLGIFQNTNADLPSQIIEQMIIEQAKSNQQQVTVSELQELKEAFQEGKQHLDDNFQTLNQTVSSIKVVKNDFSKVYKQKMQELHSLFVPNLQLNTVNSALNVRGIIGCEVTPRFQFQNQDALEIEQPNLKSIATLDPRDSMSQAINWMNFHIGGKIMFQVDQDVKVNLTEIVGDKPIIIPNQYLTLLLNHKIAASVVIPQKEIQLFISHDLVISLLFKIQQNNKDTSLYKEIDVFILQSKKSNIQFLASAKNQHFIVVFESYSAIFELTDKLTLSLRCLFNNSTTGIYKIELAQFSKMNNRLFLIGTNQAKSSVAIAVFSLDNVITLGNGWLNESQSKFVFLKSPLILEQLSNQQRHECVSSLIEINQEQYILLTNQNIRQLRLKDGIELRMSAVSLDFTKYKNQLIKIMQNILITENSMYNSCKMKSQLFEENLNKLIQLFIFSTGLTSAGIVPSSHNQLLFLVLSNVAIVQIKLEDLFNNNTPDIDGFLPHGFISLLSVACSDNNFIVSSDIAGNIHCHREICGQQNMSAKFNQPVIHIDNVRFITTQENYNETENQSSQLFNNSNLETSVSSQKLNVQQFVSFQQSGELAVFEINENGAQEYTKYYHTTVYNIHDFAFDPNHFDEMMILTACDANVVNVDKIYERKIQYSITVNSKYKDISSIKYQNLIRYHPTSYVTAIFYPEEQEFILTDLNNSDMLFCSKRLFKSIGGVYDINFTQNGNYLLISSSINGLKIYSIEKQIQQQIHIKTDLISFKTTQILNKTTKKMTEIVVGITPQNQILLASMENLIQDQGFRPLNIQKQSMEFVLDKKSKQKFISEEHLSSSFYQNQIKFIRNMLQQGIIQGSKTNFGLIQQIPLTPDMDISNFKFIERKVLSIQISHCIPNLLGAVIADTYFISSMNPQSKLNFFITAYSLETFSLSNGMQVQSFHFTTVITNQIEYSTPILLQSRVHGTYCVFLPYPERTLLYSLNILVPQICSQFRVSELPFEVLNAKISYNEDKIALCHKGSSVFIFDWNCTDFCDSEEQVLLQKEELQKAILELRLEKIVMGSGICEYGNQSSMSGSIKSGIVII